MSAGVPRPVTEQVPATRWVRQLAVPVRAPVIVAVSGRNAYASAPPGSMHDASCHVALFGTAFDARRGE
jgi:hypothetical protein